MRVGVLIVAVCMAACSSTPSSNSGAATKTAQAQEGQPGVVCTTSRPTGSFLKERICTTPEEREAQRRLQETQMQFKTSSETGAR